MLFLSYLKDEFAGQDVVPLVFSMMEVQWGTVAWQRAELKDGTRAIAVVARDLAVDSLSDLLCRESEAIFARPGDGGAAIWSRLRAKQRQRGHRDNSKSIQKVATSDVLHGATIRWNESRCNYEKDRERKPRDALSSSEVRMRPAAAG